MKNKDLINALRNEGRQPVDLNLGQVPVSPTIGRMGNYNVVVKGFSTRNAATELSSALAQMPQFLGQARNIQETAGKQAANELTTEQVIDRINKGDFEAQGFLTQFGKDKAFAEQIYNRWFKSQIRPALIEASSELDNKNHDDLLQMGEGEAFQEQARAILVNSLTNNDPSILEKISANPHTASLHNKAMEAYIPEFIAKAEATATARKLKFTKDSALQSVTDDVVSLLDQPPIPDYKADKTLTDTENKNKSQKYYTKQRKKLVNHHQSTLEFAMDEARASGLEGSDLIQARKNALAGLESRMGFLLEREETQEFGAILTAMREGVLKIDGKTFGSSKDGLDLMTKSEFMLERYEDKLEADNERDDFNKEKTTTWILENIESVAGPVHADRYSAPEDYEAVIEKLNTLRSSVWGYGKDKVTGREKLFYLEQIKEETAELEALKDKRIDYITFVADSPKFDALVREIGLGEPLTIEKEINLGPKELTQRAGEFGLEPEVAFLMPFREDNKGDSVLDPDIDLLDIPSKARENALRSVIGPEFRAYRKGTLTLDEQKTDELQEKYNNTYADEFKTLVRELAREKGYIATISPTKTDARTGRESEVITTRRQEREFIEKGYPLQDGRIKYERGPRRPSLPATASHSFGVSRDQPGFEQAIDTDSAYKMVLDPNAVKEMRESNLESERIDFNNVWLKTKYSKQAKSDRAKAIEDKPITFREPSLNWEVQQSEVTGLPMEILRTDKGFSKTTYMKDNGFFAFDTEEPFEIDYDRTGSLTNKDAPKKRIFNVNAVYKATRLNDFEDLIFIATEYGHAPEGANVQSPEIQSFLNQQKVLINKYGFMDFRPREAGKPFEPPKEKTLEDYRELYENSAITDSPKEEGSPPVSATVAPNLKEGEESVETKITGRQGESGISVYSPQKGGENGGDKMEGGYPSSKPGPDGKFLVRTVQEYAEGKHDYITLAGNPAFYNKEYVIPDLPYKDPKTGEKKIFNNVRAIVHDTGDLFKTAPEFRFDIPLGKDLKRQEMEDYELLLKTDGISYIPAVEPREGGPVDQPVEQPVDSK